MITKLNRTNIFIGATTVLCSLLFLISPVKVFADPVGSTPGPVGSTPGAVGSTPGVVGSTPGSGSGTTGLTNPLNVGTLDALITEILQYAIILGGILLSFMLVYVGFQFVMAQGNPEAVSKARSMLLWTVIGGMLLLGAQSIAIVITSTVKSL